MGHFDWAVWQAWALGQLADLFAGDVVSVALLLVAWLAEMRVSPAEPLGNGAAELAFELDEVRAVGLAVRGAQAELLRGTLGAYKFLRLELL